MVSAIAQFQALFLFLYYETILCSISESKFQEFVRKSSYNRKTKTCAHSFQEKKIEVYAPNFGNLISGAHIDNYPTKAYFLSHSPVVGVSGLDDSLRHMGTKTVISLWPRLRNQSTQILMPRQENRSLLP